MFALNKGKMNHLSENCNEYDWQKVVKFAQNLKTQEKVVVKIHKMLIDTWNKSKDRSYIDTEITYLNLYDHFRGKKIIKKNPNHIKVYIFEGYIEGETLANIIERNKNNQLNLIDFLCIATEMLKEYYYKFHKLKLIHRDLKSPNIICNLKDSVIIRFIDYESIVRLDKKNKYESDYLFGTTRYFAPELKEVSQFNQKNNTSYRSFKPYCFNEKTEVYALGCILQELYNCVDKKTVDNVVDNKISFTIERMRSAEIRYRYTVLDSFERLLDAKDLLDKLLKKESALSR
ncbi:MAG: calcium-dependent kinase [Francisellaceae bacterium]|nr:calcium-dependent kinase [Francisellaceae bacterium]